MLHAAICILPYVRRAGTRKQIQDDSSSQTRELGCVLAVKSEGHDKQIELWPPEAKPFLQVVAYDNQGRAEVNNQRNAVLKAATTQEAEEWLRCFNGAS